MRVLFIEPPKDFWFIMGEYVPPPFGILCLAGYLEKLKRGVQAEIIDSQAESLDWNKLRRRIESFQPDIVVPSGLSTCNAYNSLLTVELAKSIDPTVSTVLGGQHFTALADESLKTNANIDFIVRGEGEQTLLELVDTLERERTPSHVKGLSYRHESRIIHNPERPLITDLNSLPFPGYYLVEKHMKIYHFALMAEKKTSFAIIEGSRGCVHNCSYCSQWRFWCGQHRTKSPRRVADEIEHVYNRYNSKFFWLTDDNFIFGSWADELCTEIIKRGLGDDVTWFCQARCDDILNNKELIPKMQKAGNIWMLIGFDSPDYETLNSFRRTEINSINVKEVVNLLRQNDIFSQGTFIIGGPQDSHESIDTLREYADKIDPDIATFMTLTPFPGTEIYETAKQRGWIEDKNWSHYDMIHAIMPTQYLSRNEVQEELYNCYRIYFSSWPRRYRGFFSSNPIKKRTYQYLARKAILTGLRSLF